MRISKSLDANVVTTSTKLVSPNGDTIVDIPFQGSILLNSQDLKLYYGDGTIWNPCSGGSDPISLNGDVTGPSDSNTVVALQNIPISATPPGLGDVLTYTGGQLSYQTIPLPIAVSLNSSVVGISANPSTINPPQMAFSSFGSSYQLNDVVVGAQTQRTLKLVFFFIFNVGFPYLADANATWSAGTFPFQLPTGNNEAMDGFAYCENSDTSQAQPMFGVTCFQFTPGGLTVAMSSVPATPRNPVVPPATQIQYKITATYTWRF